MKADRRRPHATARSRINDGSGAHPEHTPIAPHRWCGERDCLIGPFPHDRAAHAFTGAGPAGEAYENYRFELCTDGTGIYLRVTRAGTSEAVPFPPDPHANAQGPR